MRARYSPEELVARAMQGKQTKKVNAPVYGSGRTKNQKKMADETRKMFNRIARNVKKYGAVNLTQETMDMMMDVVDQWESGEKISKKDIKKVSQFRGKDIIDPINWTELLSQFIRTLHFFDPRSASWFRSKSSKSIENEVRSRINAMLGMLESLYNSNNKELYYSIQKNAESINEAILRAMYDYQDYERDAGFNKFYELLSGQPMTAEEQVAYNDYEDSFEGDDYYI